MSITKELVQFRSGAPDHVIERMQDIAARRDGREWVNFQPWVDEDAMPKVSVLRHLFSGRGFVVPTGTWVPGHAGSKTPKVDEVGMTHPAGHNARGQLHEAGVVDPDGWTAMQDHTKRGLVYALKSGTPPTEIVAWVVQAAAVLAGDLDVDDRWVAGFITQE